MELRFGRAGVFGALAYSYLLYQLSEGQMNAVAPHPLFHWMVVYWLAATALAVGWQDHEALDWVRLDRALQDLAVPAEEAIHNSIATVPTATD